MTDCQDTDPPERLQWRFDDLGNLFNASDRMVWAGEHSNSDRTLRLGSPGTEQPGNPWRHCVWAPDADGVQLRATGCSDGAAPDPVRLNTSIPPVQAAVSTADKDAYTQYLFHGPSYARFDPATGKAGTVQGINDFWPSLQRTGFRYGFDSGFEAEKYGKRQLVLFKGDQYVRVEIPMGSSTDTLAKGPLPIRDGFHLFRGTAFEYGVDAAVGLGDDKIMVFRRGSMGVFQLDIDGNGDKWIVDETPISSGLPAVDGTGMEKGVDTALVSGKLQSGADDTDLPAVELISGGRVLTLRVHPDRVQDSELAARPDNLTRKWPGLKNTVFDGGWLDDPGPPGRIVLRNGPKPAADPEPDRPAPFSTDPGQQPSCRPDGMTATKDVNTPYCQIYDDKGRELMGERHPRRVVGYFTGWRTGKNGQPMYLPNSIPWGQVSHINYAFAHVGKDNRISVGDTNDPANPATGMTWPDVPGAEMDDSLPYKGNFNLLNKYKKKHPRVKTLISIGGWAETGGTLSPDGSREKTGGLYTLTNNDDGSVNQPAIDTFADSVVDFLRTYGFDGADIDYEYPTSLKDAGNPEDWPIANARRKGLNAGNTALMKTLREKLDAASEKDGAYYQLTAAASASGYLLRGQQDFRALQYLDFVNSMSYDFHGSWNNFVGPQAPLYDDGKDAELAAAGIYDKEKNPEFQQEGYFNTDWSYHYLRGAMAAGRINLGVPYYTRGWKHVKGGTGDGLWGTSELPDQKNCPEGTGPDVSKTPCGAGADGVDNIWHDENAAGDALAAGSNPMWHAKNLERGVSGGYLGQYGVSPDAPDSRVDGYTRHWDDTLKASWLWNDDKKVFLTTQDEQDIAAKADYIKDKGAGGAMIWELAGDYACPEDASDQCVPGYTLTKKLDESLRDAGPYGAKRTGKTELPEQVLDVDVEFADYPTEDLWPLQPKLRITNNSDKAIAGGAKVSFDLPTSAPPVVKDGNWQAYEEIEPGHSGPNAGGLKGEFHRVTITLEACQEIPAGRSMDVPVKYFLPATGPVNVTLTSEGETFGVTGDKRQGTHTVDPPDASAPCAAPDWDRDADHYNKGDVVTHDGGRWLAQWWANKGDEPGVAPVWRDISPNP
ncbi:glycosyl hydrolase family 18 protein [Streptomyces sp. PmtG]